MDVDINNPVLEQRKVNINKLYVFRGKLLEFGDFSQFFRNEKLIFIIYIE